MCVLRMATADGIKTFLVIFRNELGPSVFGLMSAAGNDLFILLLLSFSSISLFLTLIMQPSWFTATLNNALQTDVQSFTLQHTFKKADTHTNTQCV